jgi:hypothetical protein
MTTQLINQATYNALKGFGLTDYEVSKGFFDLGISMKDNKGGYNLSTLKAKISEVVKDEDPMIQTYLTKLQTKPEMKQAA